jgi:hypothetical protein
MACKRSILAWSKIFQTFSPQYNSHLAPWSLQWDLDSILYFFSSHQKQQKILFTGHPDPCCDIYLDFWYSSVLIKTNRKYCSPCTLMLIMILRFLYFFRSHQNQNTEYCSPGAPLILRVIFRILLILGLFFSENLYIVQKIDSDILPPLQPSL